MAIEGLPDLPPVEPLPPVPAPTDVHYINSVFPTGSKALSDYLAENFEGKSLQGNAVIQTVDVTNIPPHPETGVPQTKVAIKISKKEKDASW